MVGEVGGLGEVISCDGWEGPLCWNGHVWERASSRLRMVRHLGSSCQRRCLCIRERWG